MLYASEAGLLDDISKDAMGRPLQEIIDKMSLAMDMDEEPTWYNFIFDKSVHYDYIGKPNPRLLDIPNHLRLLTNPMDCPKLLKPERPSQPQPPFLLQRKSHSQDLQDPHSS